MSNGNKQNDKQVSNYRFNLSNIIGKGSYGTVYQGKNITNGQKVALKIIPSTSIINQQNQMMIKKEIEIMKKFDNENIVRLFDVLETANNVYIVTEFCDGPDLSVYLQDKIALCEFEAIKVMRDIVKGLREIVSNGISHRDLKPANVVKHGDFFKITDFGFSRQCSPTEMMKSLVGTPLYMAPQLLMHQPYTDKCDIWSLGLLFYEMLFACTPWKASSIPDLVDRIQREPLQFPTNRPSSASSRNFIRECLRVDESKRISWAQIFEHDLFEPIRFNKFKEVIAEKVKQQKLMAENHKTEEHKPEEPRQESQLPVLKPRNRSLSTYQFPIKNNSPKPYFIGSPKTQFIGLVNTKLDRYQKNVLNKQIETQQATIKAVITNQTKDEIPSNTSSQSTNNNSVKNQLIQLQDQKLTRIHSSKRTEENKDYYIPQLKRPQRMRRTRSQLDNLEDFTKCDVNQTTKNISKPQKSLNIMQTAIQNRDQVTPRQTNNQQDSQKELLLILLRNIETYLVPHRHQIKQLINSHRDILTLKVKHVQPQVWIDGRRCIQEAVKELRQRAQNEKDQILILMLTTYVQVVKAHIEQPDNSRILLQNELLKQINGLVVFQGCDNAIKKPLKTKS